MEQQGDEAPEHSASPQYAPAEAASAQAGWQHPSGGMTPPLLPVPGLVMPEGWQHGGSWQAAPEPWAVDVTQGVWTAIPHPQAGPSFAAAAYAMQAQTLMSPYGGFAMAAAPPQMQQLPPHQGGVIFLCDPRTEEECLQRGLFGLPASQTQIVRAIVPESTLLFLFNVRVRQMLGVFRATCWPQQNLEPGAWADEASPGASRFPLQVRVRLDTPAVLMLSEDKVRSVLEYRGSPNRFDLQLSKQSAAALAQLFHTMGARAQLASALALHAFGGGGGAAAARADGGSGGGGAHTGGDFIAAAAAAAAATATSARRNGLVFICDPTTEAECLERRLLGFLKSQATLLSVTPAPPSPLPAHTATTTTMVTTATTPPAPTDAGAQSLSAPFPRTQKLTETSPFLFNVRTRSCSAPAPTDPPASSRARRLWRQRAVPRPGAFPVCPPDRPRAAGT